MAHLIRPFFGPRQFLAFCSAATVACDGGATAVGKEVTTYHGVSVADPYRWLEDGSSPRVKRWIDMQNAHTDSVVAGFTRGPTLAQRVSELANTSPDRLSPSIAGRTLYYLREMPPQPQPVLVAADWPGGAERVLIDVNAQPGALNITAFWPSASGRYVAYGTASGGSELTTIHFVDTKTHKTLGDTLPFAGGGTSPPALAWDADERGVTFARFPIPPAGQPVSWFDLALYHHTLGAGDDVAAFGLGYSRIAEYALTSSSDGRHAAMLVHKGDSGPAEVYVRDTSGWRRVIGDSAGVTGIAYAGSRLLAVATNGTPYGRIVVVDDRGRVSVAMAERTWSVQSVSPIAGGMLVVEDSGPRWRVEHVRDDGSPTRTVALPNANISITNITSSDASAEAIIGWNGWTTPPRWQRYDGRTGRLTTIFEVTSTADLSRVATTVIDAVSKDGTHVPVTVLSLAGTPRDGTAPAILGGYGGFDISTAPEFGPSRLAWLERGGVLAFANLRGGSEFGEDWHRAGMGVHKQNVFDDFHAAAQALVQGKWTSPQRLGIVGGSNGGLLMGAELTQHPGAFRAVVSSVGIYDMLRHETFPNGAFNVPEFGGTADSAQFAALYAYSPLHRVRPGTAYPSVLLETAVNDARVAPWQSRKFAAALQSATSSKNPVLLLTRMNAGHGVDAPFAQRVGEAAMAYTFFAHELGLGEPPSTQSDARRDVKLRPPR